MTPFEKALRKSVRKYGKDEIEVELPRTCDETLVKAREFVKRFSIDRIREMSLGEIEAVLPSLYEYFDFLLDEGAFAGEDPFSDGEEKEQSLCENAAHFRSKSSHRMF